MNRVVSRRLLPKVDRELREGIWHLSELGHVAWGMRVFTDAGVVETALKVLLAVLAFWTIYSQHSTSMAVKGMTQV